MSDTAPASGAATAPPRALPDGLARVDEVGVRARAADLATRTLTGDAEARALDAAISMVDLTTLEGADTPDRVRALAGRAVRPDPTDPSVPRVAAVCVYPDLVSAAAEALAGTGVGVASVATAFPSGRAPLEAKLAEVRRAVADGATEIDMVIDRGAFLAGDHHRVSEEISAVRRECGRAHLKVILETGELGGYDDVYRACWLAMAAGADFVKTSTGKTSPAATPPVVLVMLRAVRDFHAATGRRVGVKPAGGIRTVADALGLLVLVHEVAGDGWLTPRHFRLGASSLLNALLRRRTALATGIDPGPDHATLD